MHTSAHGRPQTGTICTSSAAQGLQRCPPSRSCPAVARGCRSDVLECIGRIPFSKPAGGERLGGGDRDAPAIANHEWRITTTARCHPRRSDRPESGKSPPRAGRDKVRIANADQAGLWQHALTALNAVWRENSIEERIANKAPPVPTIMQDFYFLQKVLSWGRTVRGHDLPQTLADGAAESLRPSRLNHQGPQTRARAVRSGIAPVVWVLGGEATADLPMRLVTEYAIASAMRFGEICRLIWRTSTRSCARSRSDTQTPGSKRQGIPG